MEPKPKSKLKYEQELKPAAIIGEKEAGKMRFESYIGVVGALRVGEAEEVGSK
jgi:hypothetical protein